MVIVDLWPASSRPYVGGSTNNTVRNLVFGYNGIGRVDGTGQIGGGGGGGAGGRAPFGNLGGPGGVFGGAAGWLRMFGDAVGGQIAWLLPLAGVACAFGLWHWRRDRTRLAAVALWGGWLALYFVIFSNAKGIFHSYYTSAMVPAIGALVGIGGAAALRAMSRRADVALLAAVAVAVTAWVQWVIARRTPTFHEWARWTMVLLVAASVIALVAMSARTVTTRRAGGALGDLAGRTPGHPRCLDAERDDELQPERHAPAGRPAWGRFRSHVRLGRLRPVGWGGRARRVARRISAKASGGTS